MSDPITVAVVVGGHPHDVIHFHQLFRKMDGIDAYVQHMDEFASSEPDARDAYDAVVFYTMLGQFPPEGQWYAGDPKAAIERLLTTGQGVVVLHHSILAYGGWETWNELVGIEDRSFDYFIGERFTVHVADTEHPITRGLDDWKMTDETYTMAEPGEDSHVLLTTDHSPSMRSLAWTREVDKARVFCFQSGHDDDTWQEPGFREVLRRGIAWTARQL
jgi:type 1 glutamine amidotransferase